MKADYGIDAPKVVTMLLVFGVFAVCLGLLFGFIAGGFSPLSAMLFISGLVMALIVAGVLMIRSSKAGKYITRERVFDLLELKGNERVLDVGCGRGLFLNGIARRLTQGTATGIDLWKQDVQSGNTTNDALKNAEREGVRDRVSIRTADMRELPFDDGAFDVVVSNLAVHKLPSEQDRVKAIHEIARMVPEGGKIAIVDFRYIQDNAITLKEANVEEVRVISTGFAIFPPVKLILATK
jgi:cyclopropane fatty-acyl-phospholipid synthase-like methyltransferase